MCDTSIITSTSTSIITRVLTRGYKNYSNLQDAKKTLIKKKWCTQYDGGMTPNDRTNDQKEACHQKMRGY